MHEIRGWTRPARLGLKTVGLAFFTLWLLVLAGAVYFDFVLRSYAEFFRR